MYKHRQLNASKDWWGNGRRKFVFSCVHSDTGLLEQTDMETFLAFSTQSNAFTAWDLSLLNSLKDKRHAQTLSTPPSLSHFVLQPVAFTDGSYLTRKLHCSHLSTVSHHGEVSSFSLELCCVLLYWFCVWAWLLFSNQWKAYVGCPSCESPILSAEYSRRSVSIRWLMQNNFSPGMPFNLN